MLVWTSDTHLNFLKPKQATKFFGEALMQENPDATGLIITGDISDGKRLEEHLRQLAAGWTKPIYFVLGNHDYYDSSWKRIDFVVARLTKEIPNLFWLNEGSHEIDGHVICGCGGWYDAYHGNSNSCIDLNDFYIIDELQPQSKYRPLLLEEIRKRAGYEADVLTKHLREACKTDNKVIVVCTHVAPYAESAWHEGKHSDAEWVPWFSSMSTGTVLDRFAENNPEKQFVVLCGHSHGSGIYQRKDNMTVYTGPARYGMPDVTGVLNTKERKLWAYGSSGEKVE